MKKFLFLLAVLAGCSKPVAESPLPVSDESLALAWARAGDGGIPKEMVLQALSAVPNSNDVWLALACVCRSNQLDYLSSLSFGELARREETIRRGTSRSGYTVGEIEEARRLKEGRKK